MSLSINMLAPNATPNLSFTCRSGNIYTSGTFGVITGVLGRDAVDLFGEGCIPLTSSYLGLPWQTGRFYGLPPGATQAAVLTVLGTLYAVPVFVPTPVTLTSINYSVTTGQTGGKVRGALFADLNGYPGAIVAGTDTGDLAGTSTAVVTKGSLAVGLASGWYWLATIATASSTMPSVIGATATYPNFDNAILGSDTAAHALATSAEATTGLAITGQTYPATDMPTSFPTFPASAALQINVTTPIGSLGV